VSEPCGKVPQAGHSGREEAWLTAAVEREVGRPEQLHVAEVTDPVPVRSSLR
jgi:hypothetical protein